MENEVQLLVCQSQKLSIYIYQTKNIIFNIIFLSCLIEMKSNNHYYNLTNKQRLF